MKAKVYIETTIISYLTAWRSPQLVIAAQQEATRKWWDDEKDKFDDRGNATAGEGRCGRLAHRHGD